MNYKNISEAAFHGDIAEVRSLIRNGQKVEDVDENGHNVLHNAIASLNYGLVELILKSGADVNRIDVTGRSPLCHAIDSECDRAKQKGWDRAPLVFVDLLLRHDANPLLKDSKGRDAFDYARIYGDDRLVALLAEVMDRNARR